MRSFLAYFYRKFLQAELPSDVFDVAELFEKLGGDTEEEDVDPDTDEVVVAKASSKWYEV